MSLDCPELENNTIFKLLINRVKHNLWLTTQGYDEALFNNFPTQLMHDAVRERYRESSNMTVFTTNSTLVGPALSASTLNKVRSASA